MKKLTILTIILTLAASANAMTLQISLMGNPDPHDGIYVLPGETIDLDIHSPDGYVQHDDVYWALVTDPALGTLTGGLVTPAAPPDSGIYGYDAQAVGMCPPPEDGPWGAIMNIAGLPVDPGVYIDEIIFYRDPGQYVEIPVHLYSTPDFLNFTLEDTFTFLTPEPGALGLFSLGGLLFLRRRKQN